MSRRSATQRLFATFGNVASTVSDNEATARSTAGACRTSRNGAVRTSPVATRWAASISSSMPTRFRAEPATTGTPSSFSSRAASTAMP